eukprot:1666857-Pyramimonas_sp.AAC.1
MDESGSTRTCSAVVEWLNKGLLSVSSPRIGPSPQDGATYLRVQHAVPMDDLPRHQVKLTQHDTTPTIDKSS